MAGVQPVRFLIVGYGNPLRCDDGLGWHVAQQLSHEPLGPDVQVIAAHQLTPEIAEAASRAEHVLFIDAASQGEPGSMGWEGVSAGELPRQSHEGSPAAVLKLAKELYGRSPQAQLLTIAGESFDAGETMSAAVLATVPALIEKIKHLVRGG